MEIIGRRTGGLIGSSTWQKPTRRGAGVDSISTTAGGAYWPQTPLFSTIGTEITVAALVEIDGISDVFGRIINIPYRNDATWTSPFNALAFCRNGNTSGGFFGISDSGGTTYSVTSSNGFIGTTDSLHLYAVTRRGATVRFYLDGLLFQELTSFNSTAVPYFANGADVNFANRNWQSQGEGVDGRLVMGALWNRDLAPEEVGRLWADPFDFIRPRRYPKIGTAGAPPGPPLNLTATAVSSSRIDFAFDPPASGGAPTQYKIYRSTTPGFTPGPATLIDTIPA